MSKDGYYGDFDSLEHEQEAYREYLHRQEQEQEPEVVPCYRCGNAMYQESYSAEGNLCSQKCKDNLSVLNKE